METLGKKLYKSTALLHFKLIYLSIAAFLLVSLTAQTYNDPVFQDHFEKGIKSFFAFHWVYPEDLLVYLCTIFFPAIYYSFIRGIVFCENGMIINRGLPFFNRNVFYENIESYRVIHPKFLMAVKRSDIEEEFVFTIKDINRAIAIFDQHQISGDLRKENLNQTMTVNKKLIIFFALFGAAMFIFQYFGGFAKLLR